MDENRLQKGLAGGIEDKNFPETTMNVQTNFFYLLLLFSHFYPSPWHIGVGEINNNDDNIQSFILQHLPLTISFSLFSLVGSFHFLYSILGVNLESTCLSCHFYEMIE